MKAFNAKMRFEEGWPVRARCEREREISCHRYLNDKTEINGVHLAGMVVIG